MQQPIDTANVSAAISVLEERLRAAMLAGDVAELDALIDDRLLFIGPDGDLYRKHDDLELHRTGATRITRLDLHGLLIETHESIAIVSVVADMAGSFKGQPFVGRNRYLRTWLRDDAGWRVVGGSVCALPA